ncbi:hypothetical protein ACN27F_01810 [Solwaraspora sp. WMMB335]|uniref:hypothetical protein n=1 Tax=Solwaraspora sp. WMMB335 TaxID=3404118 RepID=UPI003B94DA8C
MARQHPGEPVIESPSGMIRTGAAADADGTVMSMPTTTASAVSAVLNTAATRGLGVPGMEFSCHEMCIDPLALRGHAEWT